MLTEVFAALGDETRLHLVSRLLEKPLSITELTADSQMTRQGVTRHLRVMERAGLVHVERHGSFQKELPQGEVSLRRAILQGLTSKRRLA